MRDLGASLEAHWHQDAEGTVKTRDDLARYRSIIRRTRPEVIVETGTYRGGSAAWFARFAPVITVDLAAPDRVIPGVRYIVGDSADPDVVRDVVTAAGGRPALVSLDSDHSAAHVRAEMDAYADLVPPGGYMVVEDGLLRWLEGHPYDGTPADAVEAWLSEHADWRPDLDLEDGWPTTQHPGGWLRRRA